MSSFLEMYDELRNPKVLIEDLDALKAEKAKLDPKFQALQEAVDNDDYETVLWFAETLLPEETVRHKLLKVVIACAWLLERSDDELRQVAEEIMERTQDHSAYGGWDNEPRTRREEASMDELLYFLRSEQQEITLKSHRYIGNIARDTASGETVLYKREDGSLESVRFRHGAPDSPDINAEPWREEKPELRITLNQKNEIVVSVV